MNCTCDFLWHEQFGWVLPSAGGVISVNGDVGPAVTLTAADIPSDGPSDVQTDIDLLKPITTQAELEARYPNVAGVHTIDAPTRFAPPPGGGPITLVAGRSIVGVFPGSIESSGGVITTIIGDVAGPLISGELPITNLQIGNTNAAGQDIDISSIFGRAIVLEKVQLVGANPGMIRNITGAMEVETLSLQPVNAGATALQIDGTIAALAFYKGQAVSPGGGGYTAFEVLSTCNVAIVLAWLDTFWNSSTATDGLIYIDPAATLPTSAIPTNTLGCRITGVLRGGPGTLFAAGSLDEKDIRLFVGNNPKDASSRYLGDGLFDGVSGAATLTYGAAGVLHVVPPGNGVETVTLNAVSERHSISIDSAIAPYRWALQFDGPNDALAGGGNYRAEIIRNGGGTPQVELFLQRKNFSGTGLTTLLIWDIGAPGLAPDGAYTVTINGTTFTENSVAQTKAQVVTNLRATVDAGIEPVITGASDAPEAFEIQSTTGATFSYSATAPITVDLWETLAASKDVITLANTSVVFSGDSRYEIDHGDRYRMVSRTDLPANASDFLGYAIRNEGLP